MWPPEPGIYALLFSWAQPLSITAGRLGTQVLPPGHYVYVGSARGPGGLAARLERHLRPTKRLHWHVDFLTQKVLPCAVLFTTETHIRECDWVARLLHLPGASCPWPGFGNSDCRRCPGHLLRLPPVRPTLLQCHLTAEGCQSLSPDQERFNPA